QRIDLKVIPDAIQRAPPTLAMGWLCGWSREAEITPDRGGLLCCQNPQVAYNAMLRLLSGLHAPSAEDFDAEAVVRQFSRWQNEPLGSFLLYLKNFSRTPPYLTQQLAQPQ